MFTGIVEGVAKVKSFEEKKSAYLLQIDVSEQIAKSLNIGDSLACNGCCLTVVSLQENIASFELLEESVRLTNFSEIKVASIINVERPLAADARLGGHFVSGHIDTKGKVEVFEQIGKNYYLKVSFANEFSKYAVYKGSIAIDGISLTIAEAKDNTLSVWLIPHTLDVTNLSARKVGESVNLEFDILAKYIEKIALNERKDSPYQEL